MIDFLLFALNLSWKILGLVFGWMLFKYILQNGSGTFREILDTITIGLRAMGHAIRKKLYNYLKKEADKEKEPDAKVTVE